MTFFCETDILKNISSVLVQTIKAVSKTTLDFIDFYCIKKKKTFLKTLSFVFYCESHGKESQVCKTRGRENDDRMFTF